MEPDKIMKIDLEIPSANEVTIILDEQKGTIAIDIDAQYSIQIKQVKKLFHKFIRRDLLSPHDTSHTDDDVPF